jgi:fatty-acyl-CoA synthase
MVTPSSSPDTLTGALRNAGRSFQQRGITLLDGRGREVERRTYAVALASFELAAKRLKNAGTEPGDRVLICLPTSWAWLEAWFGALLAGALPVGVAPPPALGSPAATLARLDRVSSQLEARLIVTSASLRAAAAELPLASASAMRAPEELAGLDATGSLPEPARDPEAIAFLQLTSGSTGSPRAVAISHRAAVHNPIVSSEAIGAPVGAPASAWADSLVCWLPLHHDMGLVGGVLYCLLNGFDLHLLAPQSFLARPHVWLSALARAGVTQTAAPNFAYLLASQRIKPQERAGLDLSQLSAAMTGSEMVRRDSMAAFCDTFADRGLAPRAIRPCYGLAEATLAVTFDCRGEGVRTRAVPAAARSMLGANEVVCLGVPVRDTEVRVVAPDGGVVPEETIGEVRVRGPGICSGYYRDEEATEEVLRDGWLATGDLGFIASGELYLTGRRKEILIVHGHNIMPHDLEWIAEAVTASGGATRCGAFSVPLRSDSEQAVLVVETEETDRERLARLEHEIRSRIGRELSLPLADLAFVKRGTLPKTTSGKVQRGKLRQQYLDQQIERFEV